MDAPKPLDMPDQSWTAWHGIDDEEIRWQRPIQHVAAAAGAEAVSQTFNNTEATANATAAT